MILIEILKKLVDRARKRFRTLFISLNVASKANSSSKEGDIKLGLSLLDEFSSRPNSNKTRCKNAIDPHPYRSAKLKPRRGRSGELENPGRRLAAGALMGVLSGGAAAQTWKPAATSGGIVTSSGPSVDQTNFRIASGADLSNLFVRIYPDTTVTTTITGNGEAFPYYTAWWWDTGYANTNSFATRRIRNYYTNCNCNCNCNCGG